MSLELPLAMEGDFQLPRADAPVTMSTDDGDDFQTVQLVVNSKAIKRQASSWYCQQDPPQIEWWVDCQEDVTKLIEAQYTVNPHAIFIIPGNAGGPAGVLGWKFNLEEKVQQNLKTGKERWIRKIVVLDE